MILINPWVENKTFQSPKRNSTEIKENINEAYNNISTEKKYIN
jgi:hypothetical protein